ncbi:CGNR zinc finger domain-containing protein [Streptomyces platensis]|uniref:CGNR zinc finger domain-containing protein n=1 Tax=Streptomyces platensis TaxID=58346 RepID=UPI002ED2133F|nr:CGNR zinc finger domain-containing protein [Streptomyces platensis]
MHFNAYGGNAALLAAALANLDDRCDTRAVETLLAEHRVARTQLTDQQLELLRAWSLCLWEAFAACTTPEQVAVVNRLLADAAASPYVSTHDGQPPHLHYADENADVVTRVRAATAAGLALVLTETDPCRLGRCAAPGCRTVFLDVSRNGRREYCSRQCATRVHVSEHRDRQRRREHSAPPHPRTRPGGGGRDSRG